MSPGLVDSPPRGIDWDAATAAALTDEPETTTAVGGGASGASQPDRLLEDLIREIVGDAAADTASSLHASPPSHADVDGGNASQSTVVEQTVSVTTSLEPQQVAVETQQAPIHTQQVAVDPHQVAVEPSQVADGPELADLPSGSSAAQAATLETHDTHDQQLSDAQAASRTPPPQFTDYEESASVIAEPRITVPDLSPTIAAIAAYPAIDVSRETSADYGGTPLAYELADETRRRVALDEAVLPLPAKTRILTISNQKGGVGKTTTAVNLAAALARAGAKVLVVDLDPQGNASTALGVDHRSEQQSVYEVLVADLPLVDVVRRSTEHENLDCVPATIHLAGAEIELVSLVAREQRLRRALDTHLASMAHPYDYVFIDCPPSLGLLTINAFVAAREVLIPIQCEYYALEGLSQLLSNIELIEKHLNSELRLSTILLTMYDSRTNLAQQVAQEVRDHFPVQTLETIIPRSVRVSEAPSYGQSVISYDFASSGSLSYREAAAEIARRGAAQSEEIN